MTYFDTPQDACEWLQAISVTCKTRMKRNLFITIILAAALVGTLVTIFLIAASNIIAFVIWGALAIMFVVICKDILYPEYCGYKYIASTAALLAKNPANVEDIMKFMQECFKEEE